MHIGKIFLILSEANWLHQGFRLKEFFLENVEDTLQSTLYLPCRISILTFAILKKKLKVLPFPQMTSIFKLVYIFLLTAMV
jgi:hypothetical protein